MACFLVLGGTMEARWLAERLTVEGHLVVTSLAGRTARPSRRPGGRRIGGFGGAYGLARYLRAERFDAVIDATHPFATRITMNAARAATIADTPRITLSRPPWRSPCANAWAIARDEADAAARLPSGAVVFLALGRQHVGPFAARSDVSLVARSIEPILTLRGHPDVTLVRGLPSYDADAEAALLQAHSITHLVARNSGGDGAFAKIEAASRVGLPVIMIERPAPPPYPTARNSREVIAWLRRRLSCPASFPRFAAHGSGEGRRGRSPASHGPRRPDRPGPAPCG